MFLSPEKIVEYCDVHHGMKVADFGASVGHFSIPLGRRVGGNGKIYAIDIQKDLLSKLQSEAQKAHVLNIEIVWADIETLGGTKLRDESVDRVFVANTLFQVTHKEGLVSEAKRILKKGGKVILIDWLDSFAGLGPHPQEVVVPAKAKQLFEEKGFTTEHETPAGDHHYGIIFVK